MIKMILIALAGGLLGLAVGAGLIYVVGLLLGWYL
jgi:hypothetical protein